MSIRLMIACFFLFSGPSSHADDWLTDPDAAAHRATTEERDLFLLFTGTAWCGSCIDFEAKILSQPEFWAGTTDLVRVKLEYPGREDQLKPDRREAYIAWRDRYGIRAYPTVILADPTGRPYAVTGFEDKEDNPARFVARIKRLLPVHARRDAALARASRATGLEKAQALSDALTAVRDASDPELARFHGEMVVRFYRPEIDEVIALDPANLAGLRDRYETLLASADELFRYSRFIKEVFRVSQEHGPQVALARFETEMAQAPSAEYRARLLPSKINLLDEAGKRAEALAVAEELAADTTRTAADRQAYALQAVRELVMLDRIDAANARCDQLVAAAAGDRREVYRVLRSKANLLSHSRFEGSIEAFEAARALCDPGTQEWLNVEVPRLRLLRAHNRFVEALTGFDAVLAQPRLDPIDRAVCLADRALTLTRAGRREEALKAADLADAAWPPLNLTDQSTTIDFIQGMIATARRDPAQVQPRP